MKLLGVPFPDPLTSVGRLARGLGGVALVSAERLAGTRPHASGRRAVWTCPGRMYIEVHGVHGPKGARVARRIERALTGRRAMWASVREALGILLGGNFGEIAFTVLGSALTGRSPLNARQLLLVNMLTDLAPALAIALSHPSSQSVTDVLREGPGTSLGSALTRDISTRAVTTTLGASAAWTVARFTGTTGRASTVALAALVGTQLAQTLVAGGRDRTVLTAGLGSAAVLAAVIQTPGLSQFFDCRPLGPVAWSLALGSAGAAGLLGLLLGDRRCHERRVRSGR